VFLYKSSKAHQPFNLGFVSFSTDQHQRWLIVVHDDLGLPGCQHIVENLFGVIVQFLGGNYIVEDVHDCIAL
jgi:hypothetical protein